MLLLSHNCGLIISNPLVRVLGIPILHLNFALLFLLTEERIQILENVLTFLRTNQVHIKEVYELAFMKKPFSDICYQINIVIGNHYLTKKYEGYLQANTRNPLIVEKKLIDLKVTPEISEVPLKVDTTPHENNKERGEQKYKLC